MNLYFYTLGRHRYQVLVEDNGAIKVHPRDWLSKYAMAMYGTPLRVREFARKKDGVLKPIANLNLIYAGETLYHIPTAHAYDEGRAVPRPAATGHIAKPEPPTLPALTREEAEKVALQHLIQEFHLKGEDLEWIGKLLHSADMLEHTVQIIEIIAEIFGAEFHFLTAFGVITGLAGVILTPIGVTVHLAHALGTGHRLVQMAAMAVAITAWAYDDPTPPFPKFIQKQYHSGPADLRSDEEAWKAGCLWADNRMKELLDKIQAKVQERVKCSIDETAAVVKLLLRTEPQFKGRKDVMAAVLAKRIVAKASHEDRIEEPVVYMAGTFFNPTFDRRSIEEE